MKNLRIFLVSIVSVGKVDYNTFNYEKRREHHHLINCHEKKLSEI